MKKPKFLEDEESLQYKKQLADFMAIVNPKPTIEQVEKLRQKYLEKRNESIKPTP